MVRSNVRAVVVLAFVVAGCGRDSRAPRPVSRAASPDPGAEVEPGDRPSLPDGLELELRRRTEQGDDTVLKLAPAGARLGVAHGKSRLSLRFRLPPGALAPVYQTLQQEGFDDIEVVPRDTAKGPVSSLRVRTSDGHHTVAMMGRKAPAAKDAEAYARCLAAVEALEPRDRGATVVQIRWHESIGDHAATLDIDGGDDLLGVHRMPGSHLAVDLHLAQARTVEVMLRSNGSPAMLHRVEAGRDRGLEVAFDATTKQVIARPLAAPPDEAPTP